MRLHELAKELGADSKILLGISKELRLGVKSHSSNIPKGAEGILRAAWKEELAEQEELAAEKEAKQAKPAAKPEQPTKPAASPAASKGPTMTISIGGAPVAKPEETPAPPAQQEPTPPATQPTPPAQPTPEDAANELLQRGLEGLLGGGQKQ